MKYLQDKAGFDNDNVCSNLCFFEFHVLLDEFYIISVEAELMMRHYACIWMVKQMKKTQWQTVLCWHKLC